MLITIIIFVIFVYWFTKRIIIQIIRQVDEMLYHNISPFFDPLSFLHDWNKNVCFVLQRIT